MALAVCAALVGLPASVTPPHAPVAAPSCVASNLSTWTTPRLAAQTVVVPVDQGALAAARPEISAGVGGVLLTGTSPHNLGQQIAQLKGAASPVAPLFMTDEEGGTVQRLSAVVGNVPSARQMGETMDPAAIKGLARSLGRKMYALGITVDLAPVLDADGGVGPSATDPDGTRSFSPNIGVAARDGLAFAEGLQQAGVTPVVKHFPGLGQSTGNTDFVAAKTLPWTTLSTHGLVPFAAAVRAGLPAVMVADAVVPGLTGVPASISPAAVTAVLRRQLGFKGLVVTDSLSTPAITASGYRLPVAVVDALKAGVDMVLFDATTATLATTTSAVTSAITGAVASGGLSRARLVAAATAVLRAKQALCATPVQ